MGKNLLSFFTISFSLISTLVSGQNVVGVNPQTGASTVNIPVYTMSAGQMSLPVSLSYYGNGVKTKDIEGTAGMGWQLNVGGQVSRVVKGLPDDVTKDDAGNPRLGWMSTQDTAANSIAGFSIANNGSICANETTDINYINGHFSYRNDSEPDRFMVNAPGLSCQLVYDRVSNTFKPVNYQDLTITYLTDPTSHLITSFTITNDKGITYLFGNDIDAFPANNKVTRKTIAGTNVYLKNKYLQYQYGISYYDTWSLINMTDVSGNAILLNYTTPSPSLATTDTVALFVGGATSAALQYRVSETNTPYTLLSIQAYSAYGVSPTQLNFNWTTSTTGQTVISSINLKNGSQIARNFQFGYSNVVYTPTGFNRVFLRSYSEPLCSSPVNYQFAYAGETASGGSYTTTLPDSSQNKYDYWGYYSTAPGSSTSRLPTIYVNPSTATYPRYLVRASASPGTAYTYTLSGVSRAVDPANIAAGSLTKVITAEKGNSNIIYEPNDYYDVPSATTVQGGGIRVKQIIDSVGTGSTNNIIRNYTYTNPASGASSGKPLSLPQFGFTIPYGGTNTGLALWTSASVLSSHDLSEEDHTIMYEYVKFSQTGAGSTVYRYSVPATYWDASAIPVCSGCSTIDWTPTVNDVGRTNCTSTYGPVSNAIYAYPFMPNANYDFERGLPISTISYNGDATPKKVSETYYTYQRSFSPTPITAFRVEDNVNGSLLVKAYNKYTIYYNTGELTTKVVNKVYDSPTLSQARADSTMYTYGSANHKLLTQQQSTNSDGSVVTSKISYVKDYTVASGTNANVTAIYNLQQQHINAPIETYQQVTRAGATKTISAALTLFKGVTPGSKTLYLPSRQYQMIQPDGLSGFVPMTIAGQVLNFDSTHYVRTANYSAYDKTGFPLTVDDNFKRIKTTLPHHFARQPIAVFNNAAYGEVAYENFDSDQPSATPYGFTISGTSSYSPVGSHAGNAAGLTSGTQTASSVTLTRNAAAANYIFSIWINASASGTLSLALTGISTNPTISYSAGGWTYYELKIPVGTLSSSYTVSFTSSTNISIDDILFYPDVSSVATATYDPVYYYKIAATNTNGVSAYYKNDNWGRILYTFDQDKNIVQRNTIVTAQDVNAHYYTYSPVTGGSSTITNTTPVSFSVSNADPCGLAGASVSWDFGDGTKVKTAGLISPTHSYNIVGTYTVRDTLHTQLYGDIVVAPKTITVTAAMISLTYSNYTSSNGNITSVIFTPSGGGSTYNFTGSTLQGGQVPQGNYSVQVNLTGSTHYNAGTGAGYNALVLSTQAGVYTCSDWVSSNSYTYSLSLGSATTLDFQVSTFDCTHFGGGAQ